MDPSSIPSVVPPLSSSPIHNMAVVPNNGSLNGHSVTKHSSMVAGLALLVLLVSSVACFPVAISYGGAAAIGLMIAGSVLAVGAGLYGISYGSTFLKAFSDVFAPKEKPQAK